MSVLQKIILIVAVCITLSFVLGPSPTTVTPTENQPIIIETPQTTENVATTSLKTNPVEKSEKKPSAVTPITRTEPPPQPVKSLAEAFADLATEPATILTPGIQATNEKVRVALVNIICTTEASGPLNSISASGVFVHPKGVIMTNAHVGQYFLLKNYPRPNFTNCIIRTGSPAKPKYTAELLFLPPAWIDANAKKIKDETPTGNGEHDYALLRITGTVSSSISLPDTFSYVPISVDPPQEGSEVLVAGYPAGFLGGITIAKDLYGVSSLSRIGSIYTFGTNTADLFSVGGTIVAQQGSSGGAVTDGGGTLVGLITTSTQGTQTSARDLRAVATSYILKDFEKENGTPLETFLNGNLTVEAETFNTTTAPTLTKMLTNVLEGH